MADNITAHDINRAIEAKYSDEQWRTWFEVSASTGYNSGRRADAVVMNIWPSKDYQMHVFEVKVSRSDFKNEMKDLTKWKAVGDYADFFWLACPVGLVSVNEIPSAWGLMELTKSGLRIKKQAPANTEPKKINKGFAASLLRSGESLSSKEIEQKVSVKLADEVEKQKMYWEQNSQREMRSLRSQNLKLKKWQDEFESAFGCKPNLYTPPSKMADRIKIAASIEGKDFQRLGEQAKRLSDIINNLNSANPNR